MTVERAVIALCKDVVVNSPLRKLLNAALRNFRSYESEDLDLVERRRQIEFHSTQVGAQFLGWLLLDQAPSGTQDIPKTTASLTPNERTLFASAHNQLAELNRKCMASLIRRFPNCNEVLDVYSQYVKIPIQSTEHGELFSGDAAENVISAFAKHADVNRAASLPRSLILRFPPPDVEKLVITTEQRLESAGVFAAPEDLEQIEGKYPRDVPLRQLTRFSVALCAVRASLRSMNQMVYQAVLNDKPPIFGDKVVFDVVRIVTHRAGTGLRLRCQFSPFIDNRDLILLKPIGNDQPFDGWAVVWGTKFEVSDEFGAMIDLRLRLLNSDLSPYGNAAERL